MNILILFENSLTEKEMKLIKELGVGTVILGTSEKKKIQIKDIDIDIEKFCLKGLQRVISKDRYSESFIESILFLFLRDTDRKSTRILIRSGANAKKYNLNIGTIKNILEKNDFCVQIV